ncbi:MAG: hypothetical protein AXA67_00295 [Methylothermaceae bacteria B42]|nr:MAG: hypothetical protein AXA67_00295 [Methylothermaceae bacteria B42]HHJ38844.1 hypothetical protein [Methylothermaceae bacterium]
MTIQKLLFISGFLLAICVNPSFAKEQHFFDDYAYVIKETGVNRSFAFEQNIEDAQLRKQAGLHVLRTVYDDFTIEPDFSKAYVRERAKCYALDSRFYTYTLCFLPNEFTQEKPVLRGFVTQVPNWYWQFTHVLLPVIAVSGLLFYRFKAPQKAQRAMEVSPSP